MPMLETELQHGVKKNEEKKKSKIKDSSSLKYLDNENEGRNKSSKFKDD